jgi:hypothetical protein
MKLQVNAQYTYNDGQKAGICNKYFTCGTPIKMVVLAEANAV